MPSPFEFSTQYTLNKAHFIECFEQSVIPDHSLRPYYKALLFLLLGIALLLTQLNSYASWFLIMLSLLEALSVRFKQAWWVTRQMLSKAANHDVTITLDQQGITTQSYCVTSKLLWQDLTKISTTDKGFLLHQNKAVHYLSRSYLNEQAITFIEQKMASINN